MIGIIDLKVSNIHNVCRFFNQLELKYKVINLKKDFKDISILFIPGVGSFGTGINFLKKNEIVECILEHKKQNKLIIGVCLGMQLFMRKSEEDSNFEGLSFFNYGIQKVVGGSLKKIHVGWSSIKFAKNNFFSDFDNSKFYFTHSYCLREKNINFDISALTEFDKLNFTSFFVHENIIGCQFHLELSALNGKNLMSKIIQYQKHL